jgi:signal peptidase I
MEILRKIYLFFIDTMQTLLFAASIFLVIYVALFRPFQVNGESMYPTFKHNEYILTNLITLRFNELQRGDVIVFKSPVDAEKDYIKRIIGISGDTISLREGSVYVNDKQLNEESYLDIGVKTYGGAFMKEGESYTVPDGSLLVMGDNRPYSSDSREWGFLKKDAVIGKSFYVYWPINNMHVVKNPYLTN